MKDELQEKIVWQNINSSKEKGKILEGKIIAIEDNWIKVEEKNKIRIINGDMIRDISIAPEKYQK